MQCCKLFDCLNSTCVCRVSSLHWPIQNTPFSPGTFFLKMKQKVACNTSFSNEYLFSLVCSTKNGQTNGLGPVFCAWLYLCDF